MAAAASTDGHLAETYVGASDCSSRFSCCPASGGGERGCFRHLPGGRRCTPYPAGLPRSPSGPLWLCAAVAPARLDVLCGCMELRSVCPVLPHSGSTEPRHHQGWHDIFRGRHLADEAGSACPPCVSHAGTGSETAIETRPMSAQSVAISLSWHRRCETGR